MKLALMAPAGPRSRRRRAQAAVGGALVAFSLLASACTSPKDTLGTDVSPCFRALAVAAQAVHRHGHFSGVRYLPASALGVDLVRTHQRRDVPPELTGLKNAVCAVAYTGSFSKTSVSKGWSLTSAVGHFALVVVSAKQNQLLATIVLKRLPLRLARVFPLSV